MSDNKKTPVAHNTNPNYELPEINEDIACPICEEGIIQLNRTIHTLPDGEEILIMLMECDKCRYQNRDIISLKTAFKPGIWTIEINDGDLAHRIFRSPSGFISLPEADFEIEPGNTAGFIITTVEGILNRMIRWTSYLKNSMIEDNTIESDEFKKVTRVLDILNGCLAGKLKFHLKLRDEVGGSYVSVVPIKKDILTFEELKETNQEKSNVESIN